MNETNWSIKTDFNWMEKEDILFTYSEEEKQENMSNRSNAKLVFSPKFIPFYPKLSECWLDNTEILLYWFIDYYLSNSKDGRFYFTNAQLSELLNVSERKITDSIKKLKDIWIVIPKYKIRDKWWKIRFINQKDFLVYELVMINYTAIISNGKILQNRLAKNSTLDSQNLLENKNKNKQEIRIKENKNNIHQTKFDVLFSSFWLDRDIIEKWFEHKKTLDNILEDCKWIAYISSELEIEPNFTKDTINAIDIIRKREFEIDYVIDWIKDNRSIEESFSDLIRSDYYLPVEID